jgi:hypothetical protein
MHHKQEGDALSYCDPDRKEASLLIEAGEKKYEPGVLIPGIDSCMKVKSSMLDEVKSGPVGLSLNLIPCYW